jgi:(hydroxyamino)benzene mutase
MRPAGSDPVLGHRLLQLGTLLFLLGLLTGFAIPLLANPRMGLTSHLEGVMNGTFLLVVGLLWPRLRLSPLAQVALFWLAVYGTFANWATTLLAAAWGAGASMMPIAGNGLLGSSAQEATIAALLLSLGVAIVAACGTVLWGLRGGAAVARSAAPQESAAGVVGRDRAGSV